MKQYCFDTSGLSNPHEQLPEEVPFFRPMWDRVIRCIEDGKFAVTQETYTEMCHITGDVGECIQANKAKMLMEVGDPTWSSLDYISHFNRMAKTHREWIAEYAFKSPAKTICIPDLTSIALAKTLALPLVNMEARAAPSPKHKRIPDICDLEGVVPYDFNTFLKIEGAE